MIKIRASYQNETDKDKILRSLRKDFKIIKISNEKESRYKKIYICME